MAGVGGGFEGRRGGFEGWRGDSGRSCWPITVIAATNRPTTAINTKREPWRYKCLSELWLFSATGCRPDRSLRPANRTGYRLRHVLCEPPPFVRFVREFSPFPSGKGLDCSSLSLQLFSSIDLGLSRSRSMMEDRCLSDNRVLIRIENRLFDYSLVLKVIARLIHLIHNWISACYRSLNSDIDITIFSLHINKIYRVLMYLIYFYLRYLWSSNTRKLVQGNIEVETYLLNYNQIKFRSCIKYFW